MRPTRPSGLNPLSRILEDALRKLDLEDAALAARAVMVWPEIVGEQMAKASEARNVHGGTLHVLTRSSAWNQEFTFQKQAILRRYRERLGADLVKGLRFTVGRVRGVDPSPEHAAPEEEVRRIRLPDPEIEQIRSASASEDPELSQAIRRALTHEAQIRHWQLRHGARECPRCGAAHRTPFPVCPCCRTG